MVRNVLAIYRNIDSKGSASIKKYLIRMKAMVSTQAAMSAISLALVKIIYPHSGIDKMRIKNRFAVNA